MIVRCTATGVMPTTGSNGRRKRSGRSVGRKEAESEARAPIVDIHDADATVGSGKIRAKVEHVFRVMKCQFGYRKGSLSWHRPRTARRSSRCSRSPTYSLPAGHSRPDDEYGAASPRKVVTARTRINDENLAPPSNPPRASDVAQRFLSFRISSNSARRSKRMGFADASFRPKIRTFCPIANSSTLSSSSKIFAAPPRCQYLCAQRNFGIAENKKTVRVASPNLTRACSTGMD